MKMIKPIVLITGCSSGIGQVLCREFNQRGCKVIATARRPEQLEELKAEGIAIEKLDVNDSDDIDRVISAVLGDYGKVDILINNAGYAHIAPIIELSDSDFRAQLETNLIAPLAIAKAVAPSMKESGCGKVVNIGSISGIVTTPFSGAYCASKAALHSISDALRMELSPFGIKVITVQPGAIQSEFGATASKTAGSTLKSDSWYRSVKDALNARAESSQQGATTAEEFARVLVGKLLLDNPAAIIRLGKKSWLLPMLKRVLSVGALDNLFAKRFGITSIK